MKNHIDDVWRTSIVPALERYIAIPNQSPAFDPQWQAHGHMERAVQLIVDWVRAQQVDGLHVEVVRLDGRTPVVWMELPGESAETVLLYGHLDKQPPMEGWQVGLGPWTPVLRDGKLYGRGGADDGYAAFACVAALQALQRQRLPHARCVVLIEACEESGSYDLPAYVEALAERIGTPSLVICLDSGCGNYEQLWITTS
ncbi:MAG TPA: M20/M25/M40 family metallo-hydrolase, partial [Candidatus Dormibacteraeota bacterium]|nr:M20/M25/M40 family metallo-hydrolase [Candidatus Dormibacteraeota bacterium]